MKRRSHELRTGRFSSPGQVYHVVTTAKGRQPIFRRLDYARIVIQAMKTQASQNKAQTLAFVLMPDHLHWLIQLHGDYTLSSIVGAIKSYSAHRIGFPMWEKGFYDHALRRDEDVISVARYIVANPLRAGIAQSVADYPHWDAVWLTGGSAIFD